MQFLMNDEALTSLQVKFTVFYRFSVVYSKQFNEGTFYPLKYQRTLKLNKKLKNYQYYQSEASFHQIEI